MSESQNNGSSRRAWAADEIEAQLDEIGKVLARGAGELVKGFLFGAPRRPRPKLARKTGGPR